MLKMNRCLPAARCAAGFVADRRRSDRYIDEVEDPLRSDRRADELAVAMAADLVCRVGSFPAAILETERFHDRADSAVGLDAAGLQFFRNGCEDRAGSRQLGDVLEVEVFDPINAAEILHAVAHDGHGDGSDELFAIHHRLLTRIGTV